MSILNRPILNTEVIENSILDSICHELCSMGQNFYGILRHMEWKDHTLYISGGYSRHRCCIRETLLNLLSKYQINTIKFEYTTEDFKNELVIESDLIPDEIIGDFGVTLSNGLIIQSDRKILVSLF